MTQNEVLLTILVGLVVANVFLVALIPRRTRRWRGSAGRARGQAPLGGSAGGSAGDGDPQTLGDAPVVAAIEAFVAGVSDDTTGGGLPPPPWEATPHTRQAIAGPAPNLTVIPLRTTDSAKSGDRRAWSTPGGPRHSIDPESSPPELADAATWSRAIREESARAARFGRPVTVVMAELPHLDVLADRFGRGVADRVASEAARLLVSEGRAADRIARLGDARFGVLLAETAEVAAAGYVERVRTAIDAWLESTGLSTRLSLGWASPAEGGDVAAAALAAEQRMHDAERGSRPSPTIIARVSGTPDSARRPRRTSRG